MLLNRGFTGYLVHMGHSAISKFLWTVFPWAVLFAVALAVVFPVSLSILPGLLSIAAVTATGVRGARHVFMENRKMLVWIAGVCALCFFSVIFSIEPQESAERAAKITALIALSVPVFVLSGSFPAQVRETVLSYMPHVLIAAGCVLAVELYFNFPVYRVFDGRNGESISLFVVNKNVAVFALLFPVGLYAALTSGHRAAAAMLVIVAAGVMYKTDSQAAQLAMIVMFCAFALFRLPRRIFIHGAFALTALLLVSFPFFSQAAMDRFAEPLSRYEKTHLGGASVAMRLENYDFLSKRILEAPVTGHGIDTARYMTFDTDEIYYPGNTIMHPHNIYLQIWLEFGAIGVAFFLGFLAFIWGRVRKISGSSGMIAVTFFCMLMVILSISWSMWASWLVGAAILMSAIVRMACAEKVEQEYAETH